MSMGHYRLASSRPPRYSRQWPTLRYCAGRGSPWSSTTSTTSSRWAHLAPGSAGTISTDSGGVRGAGCAAGAGETRGAVNPTDIPRNRDEYRSWHAS